MFVIPAEAGIQKTQSKTQGYAGSPVKPGMTAPKYQKIYARLLRLRLHVISEDRTVDCFQPLDGKGL